MTPWTPENGPARHDKKVKTKAEKDQWAAVANSVLKRGGSDASAIKQANGVIKRQKRK